jgi:TPR repeat protein
MCYEADCIFFGFSQEPSNLEEAINLYEQSAYLGDPKAMMALGRIYENGLGTKADLQKAYVFYDQAAARNEPYALYWLGKACELGFYQDCNGPNLPLAFKFYKKAAELVSKEAIYKLGQFY